jgi:prepilin-type N-terminal cleavage/methylation domain-containing protein
MNNNKTQENGFTLIEILVSSAILVILGAGFLGMQYIFSQNQVTSWRNYANIEESNRVVSKFVKEIRDARLSDEGSHPLVTTSDNEIVFYSDIDYDGDVERIRYTQSTNQLIKGVIEPSGEPISYPLGTEAETVVAENVVSSPDPSFYYYNEDWPGDVVNNPLAEIDRISDTRIVKIILTINIRPDDPSSEFTLESSGQIRMLKEN